MSVARNLKVWSMHCGFCTGEIQTRSFAGIRWKKLIDWYYFLFLDFVHRLMFKNKTFCTPAVLPSSVTEAPNLVDPTSNCSQSLGTIGTLKYVMRMRTWEQIMSKGINRKTAITKLKINHKTQKRNKTWTNSQIKIIKGAMNSYRSHQRHTKKNRTHACKILNTSSEKKKWNFTSLECYCFQFPANQKMKNGSNFSAGLTDGIS